jgi:hypothetical protein
MKKPFDYEKAKAGHPLITRDGNVAKFIGVAEEGVALGTSPRLLVAQIILSDDSPVFRFSVDGCVTRQIGPRKYSSAIDHRHNLFLDAPEVLRTIRVEELPAVCWVKFRGSSTGGAQYLIVGCNTIAQKILVGDVGDFAWWRLDSLRALGVEFANALDKDFGWRKFEVAE